MYGSEPRQVFLSSDKSQAITASADFLKRLAFAAPLLGAAMTMRGAFQGAGRTVQAMLICIIGLVGVRVPAAYILSAVLNSPNGVWNSFVISAVIELLVSIVYYRKSDWAVSMIKKTQVQSMSFSEA